MELITSFWNYVSSNQYHLKNIRYQRRRTQKLIVGNFDLRLRAYSEGLSFSLDYPTHDGDAYTMMIRANGDPRYFEHATTLVEGAPKLKGWHFVALIPPRLDFDEMEDGLDAPCVYKGISLKASALRFMPFEAEDDKLDLIIYVNRFDISPQNIDLFYAVMLILEGILGRKSLYQNINCVVVEPMPDDETDLIALYNLQSYIDHGDR